MPSLQKGDVPYLDYWHWLIDHDLSKVHNRARMYWGLQEILNDKDAPDWVKEITQKMRDEFSKQLDEDGGLEGNFLIFLVTLKWS